MRKTLLRKKCQYCERRFSKAEHLKRHERSHTGERPYTCRLCDKSFSRSDVLHRHVRHHAQGTSEDAEAEAEAEVLDSATGQDLIEPQASSGAVRNLDNVTTIVETTTPSWQRLQNGTTSSQLIGQATEPVAAAYEGDPFWNASFSSGLEHQMNPHELLWPVHVDQDTNQQDADTFMAVHQEQPLFPLSAGIEGHQRPIQPAGMQQPEIFAQHPVSSTTSEYPEIHPIASGTFEGRRQESLPQDRPSPQARELLDTQSLSAANWYYDLEIIGENAYSSRDPFPLMPDSAAFDFVDVIDPTHPPNRTPCLPLSSQRSNDDIPDERFEKLMRCWPNRRDDAIRLMQTLWQDVASHTEENLFSQALPPPRVPYDHRQSGSRWGLDEECRLRLQHDCDFSFLTEHPSPARCNNNNDPIDHDASIRESISGSPRRNHPIASTVIDFPPAEILDMSLDLYFRRFHTLIPFIHVPTFDAKSTPSSMLFSMCLIGLTMLNTDGATKFVRICFSSILEKCSTELASRSLGICTPPQLMSTFAACYLTVNLATMSPETAHHEQALTLSVQMISIAQRHGLFTANDGDPLTMTLIAQHTDGEQKWKSWARIESAKRLIVCLIMADSWSAYMFHTSPIIHTDRLQILLSCEDALFRAGSAKKWAQIVHSGSLVLMPSLALDPSSAHLQKFETPLDDFGMYGLLSIIWLYILEADYRLLPPNTHKVKGKLRVPSEVYAQDPRVRFVGSLLFNVVDLYGDRFERMNPNCMVLWHSMCIMLTTDLRIIELGAGCAGAGRARQALDDIAAWSQTAAARRACVHAGQTFMIMSKRKVSDGTMFHSEATLFISALVLGLYLLTVSNTAEADGNETLESLELLDDVDWRSVVHEGLTPNGQPYNGAESLAKRFIRDGGSIQFSGLIHHGGYQSARRILLDYAGLLGDVGRWKVRNYSRVLRILSDTLLDVDIPASGNDF